MEAVVVTSFTEDIILFYVWGHLNVFPVHTDVNIKLGVVDVAGVGVIEGGRLIDTIDLAKATWNLVDEAFVLVLAVVLNRFIGVEAIVSTDAWGGISEWSVLITELLLGQAVRYTDDDILVSGVGYHGVLIAGNGVLIIRLYYIMLSFLDVFNRLNNFDWLLIQKFDVILWRRCFNHCVEFYFNLKSFN